MLLINPAFSATVLCLVDQEADPNLRPEGSITVYSVPAPRDDLLMNSCPDVTAQCLQDYEADPVLVIENATAGFVTQDLVPGSSYAFASSANSDSWYWKATANVESFSQRADDKLSTIQPMTVLANTLDLTKVTAPQAWKPSDSVSTISFVDDKNIVSVTTMEVSGISIREDTKPPQGIVWL